MPGTQIQTTIPVLLRGGVYVDQDNSQAVGGLFIATNRLLMLGQMLVAGVAVANQPV